MRRGFTLIELLVVIAVIAVLIGILLPALGRARGVGRMTACVSNIRGQGDAVLQYASTYKEAMPPRWVSWFTADAEDPHAGFWLINRVLSDFMGTPMEKPAVGFPVPAGMFRCPEIKTDQDSLWRLSHSGYLHAAPNIWLFNTMNRNDVTGTIRTFGEMLPGWSDRYGNRYWRRLKDIWRTSATVLLSDNVSYWYEPHKHNEAREAIGRATHLTRAPNESGADNIGAHDAMGRRPVSYADGHAGTLPVSHDFWDADIGTYYARSSPNAEAVALSRAEVDAFMWFIGPGDKASGD